MAGFDLLFAAMPLMCFWVGNGAILQHLEQVLLKWSVYMGKGLFGDEMIATDV